MATIDFNTELTTLDNGLRITTCPMKETETVTISIWVDVGSRCETVETNGISHFLEHMAFKGTTRRNAQEIAIAFDSIGGIVNASTGRENTSYYAKVLKEDFTIAADILSDILLHSVFDKEELERERQVILQEVAMTNDMPDDIIFDYYQETAFPNQPLGRSILGPRKNILKFTRDDLQQHIESFYTPENIVISVGGNIKHNQVVEQFSKSFGALKKGKPTNKIRPQYKGGLYRKDKELEQTHLVTGFEGISYHHDDIYTIQILAGILGGGFSSRLFQEIREKRGLAYSISAYSINYSDTGIFSIYTGVDPANVRECMHVLQEELREATHNITEEELERAKKQAIAPLMMGIESSGFRAEDCARNLICMGKNIPISETIEKVTALSVMDIQYCLQQRITGRATVAAIGDCSYLPDEETLLSPLLMTH